MISKERSLRDSRNPIGCLILLAVFAVASGCSTAESPAGSGTNVNHVLPSGNSVSGWMVTPSGGTHASTATQDYIANNGNSGCVECHGPDLAGGISRVSCFGNTAGCHHGPVAGWVAVSPSTQNHGVSAKSAPGSSGFISCQICHGSTFAGTTSAPTCLNNAACHGAGVVSPHPSLWRTTTGGTYNHNSTDPANGSVCFGCHAYRVAGNPDNPTVPTSPAAAGTPPDCFNGTMCHNEVRHGDPFNTTAHYSVTSSSFTTSCGACHDVSTPSTKGGPVCRTCHIAGSPLTALNCTSCHANPPNGPATAYPNAAGTHATHIALNRTGTPVTCNTCHNGLGTNTLNHYNRGNARPGDNALRIPPGDVAFLPTYSAETGASSFNNSASLNCSSVSCHGGQTTPNWQTGAIDVNNQCTNCHASGTAQFNSYNSGEHARHVDQFGATANTCKFCHNTASLAVNHFTTLATPAMEGPASATIGGTGTLVTTYVPATQSCSPQGGVCHGTENW